MTRDELVILLEDLAQKAKEKHRALGYWHASKLVSQLDSPPAMAWQDRVLDGLRASRDAYLRDDEYDTFERELIEDVMGEAIAVVRNSIPAPPPLPKRK